MKAESYIAIAGILKSEGISELGLVVSDSITKNLVEGSLENLKCLQVRTIEIDGVKITLWQKERLFNILKDYKSMKQ